MTSAFDLRTPAGFKAWRQAHELSQSQLGAALDVTYMTIYRYETGATPIPLTVELALRWLNANGIHGRAPSAIS